MCFASESCNCSIRLETRTKEFNWNVSRSIFLNYFLIKLNAFGVAKATGKTLVFFLKGLLHYRPIKHICSIRAYAYIFFSSREKKYRINGASNIFVETRKMVNYARTWWSQVKTWWKLALCGTDVQIVAAWSEYRGERLIEPSSSWFPPKFPSG